MNLHCERWVQRNDMGKKTFKMRYRVLSHNLFSFHLKIILSRPTGPVPNYPVPFWGVSQLSGKLFSLIRCGCVEDAV